MSAEYGNGSRRRGIGSGMDSDCSVESERSEAVRVMLASCSMLWNEERGEDMCSVRELLDWERVTPMRCEKMVE
jgi:hypothetical protein